MNKRTTTSTRNDSGEKKNISFQQKINESKIRSGQQRYQGQNNQSWNQPPPQMSIIASVNEKQMKFTLNLQTNAILRGEPPCQQVSVEEIQKLQKKRSVIIELLCSCFIGSNGITQSLATEIQSEPKQLSKLPEKYKGKKTLILDLDETLVHSSFQPIESSDYMIQIKVQNIPFTIYVKKRSGTQFFLERASEIFEIVIYTASLAEYADPVCDLIDPKRLISSRLFRENCTNYQGLFVKDLSKLGRDLKDVLIVDNSETSFLFQPENAIQISNFFHDESDRELYRLLPFLQFLSDVRDVRTTKGWMEKYLNQDQIEYINMKGKLNSFNKKVELKKQKTILNRLENNQLLPIINDAENESINKQEEIKYSKRSVNSSSSCFNQEHFAESPDLQLLMLNIQKKQQSDELVKEETLTAKVSNASTAEDSKKDKISNKHFSSKIHQQNNSHSPDQINNNSHQKFKKDLVIEVPLEKDKQELEDQYGDHEQMSQQLLIEELNQITNIATNIHIKASQDQISVRINNSNKVESTRKLIENKQQTPRNDEFFLHKTCPDDNDDDARIDSFSHTENPNYLNRNHDKIYLANSNKNNPNMKSFFENNRFLNKSFEKVRYQTNSFNLNSPIAQQDFINFLKEPIQTSPKLNLISNYFSNDYINQNNNNNKINNIPQSNKYCDNQKLKQLIQQTQDIENDFIAADVHLPLPADSGFIVNKHNKIKLDSNKFALLNKQQIGHKCPQLEFADNQENPEIETPLK